MANGKRRRLKQAQGRIRELVQRGTEINVERAGFQTLSTASTEAPSGEFRAAAKSEMERRLAAGRTEPFPKFDNEAVKKLPKR